MIEESLDQVRKAVNAACIRAGRRSEEVTPIAVSKAKPAPTLRGAYVIGIRDFGENRIQEILARKLGLSRDIRWHMIGHPQRNKVNQVTGGAVMIHLVDSLYLARQIEAKAARKEVNADILLEVNVVREESKYGFMSEEVEDIVMVIKNFLHMYVKGLITITPLVDNPEENRGILRKLFEFAVDIGGKDADNVIMGAFSTGMIGDHEVAVEEGVTMARVGTGIFSIR